ncbi:MAG: endonuclease/exonuclease/phosphatase family protein [Planctomycetota bacterium]|nr:MAG: endonuclease/exonuclease/phosphatase family protein [Planctomycetota bacterium]
MRKAIFFVIGSCLLCGEILLGGGCSKKRQVRVRSEQKGQGERKREESFDLKANSQAIAPLAKGEGVIRFATLNCEWFFDEDFSDQRHVAKGIIKNFPTTRRAYLRKLNNVAKVLLALRADFYALQEVEDREVLEDVASILNRHFSKKYRVYFVPGKDRATGQNVGVLTHFNVLSFRRYRHLRPANVSKNLTLELVVGKERVRAIVLHLKAGGRSAADRKSLYKRLNQARSIHRILRSYLRRRENVLVLGDLNCQQPYGSKKINAAYILCGWHTRREDWDDMIDMHSYLRPVERITHIAGGQLDRILFSPALVEDSSGRLDLVFRRGGRLVVPREVSDHYALWADFEIR